MSRHRPPEPPRGVYPTGNRLTEPIPSVPELQSYRDRLLAYTFLRGLGGVDDGWYSVMRDLERSEQALDDARWRLACASWRWCRKLDYLARTRPVVDWEARKLIAAWRYQGVISSPGKALALRPKTEVVA